jgi:5'-nucleotidase
MLITVPLLIYAVCLAAPEKGAAGNDFHLTILHTNDLHSHCESFSDRGHNIGGIPRIGHMIRYYKKKEPDAVVVDAGDIFEGTPIYTMYHGEVEVHLLNMIGYDIYSIGNHEFDDGPENLAKQLKAAKFTIINCNMDCSKEPELAAVIKPYTIKQINGEKVAFIGAICPDLNKIALKTGGVVVKYTGSEDWMEPIEESVKEVKALGINKIVLVTHCGVDRDQALGAALPDVDLIIGGHSHTRLDEAIVVPHSDGSSTTIVQTGCFSRALGKLEVDFDSEGRVITPKTDYHLINMTERVAEEPDLKAYVDEKVKPLLPLRHTIVGQAEGLFDNAMRTLPWDSPIGDLITDALAEEGKTYGARIAFENRGGIRARIEPGPISLEKVQEVLPFDNRMTFATVSGKCLMSNLEHGLGGSLGGQFLDEHGLKVVWDPKLESGHRVVLALAQDDAGNWLPVEADKQYKMCMNDYSFSGGEGFDFKCATNIVRQPDRLSIALTNYLKHHDEVSPAVPERLAPVTSGLLKVSGDAKTLQVRAAMPNAKLTIVCGTQKGVSAIDDTFPVPLADPQIIGHAKSDATGNCDWPLPADFVPVTPKKGDKTYFVVVVHTGVGTPNVKNTMISYPVPMN